MDLQSVEAFVRFIGTDNEQWKQQRKDTSTEKSKLQIQRIFINVCTV